jgi:hypothetical protein
MTQGKKGGKDRRGVRVVDQKIDQGTKGREKKERREE